MSALQHDFTPLQVSINDALAHLFTQWECWGGRLSAEFTGPELAVSAQGHHASGKYIPVYPIDRPLQLLLHQYAAATPGGIGSLTIEVNVRQSIFVYHHFSLADQARTEATVKEDQAAQSYLRQLRGQLSTAPYGSVLADAVAAALLQGYPFNYGHPAYCGMGFDIVDGWFRYGPIWEGSLWEPETTFAQRSDFVAWLARQSDAALALLESPDSMCWNNQVVNRARLLDLVKHAAVG